MHDLYQLGFAGLATADSASSSAIKVALITAVSVIFAAGLSALAVMRSRDQPMGRGNTQTEQVWTAFNAELSRRALHAEALVVTKDTEISRLRDLCWALGHDPDHDLPEGAKP